MKEYRALFRIKFIGGLQYRAAALAGLTTQFAWGFMEILAFVAFYRANPAAFPMEFSQTVSYIWIQQAFLALFATWGVGGDAVESIINGNIAYDLARPMNLYDRWFCEAAATRVARATLRCFPVLILAFVLPEPFRMSLPASAAQFGMFIVSAVLGFLVVCAYCMLDYMSSFYTMTRINLVFAMIGDFMSGQIIPLPFFPRPFQAIAEWLPFASMQNAPLRIYSGNIAGMDAVGCIALQFFWLAILLVLGKALMRRSLRRVVTQGG
ncbi:MAG: ABC-2 family transporter protein [Clostridiales bacterium]|jgi:ABC-2 type transport system permease protein|nr:ABC-2 family transporter protein [Clostridiales bacterium]